MNGNFNRKFKEEMEKKHQKIKVTYPEEELEKFKNRRIQENRLIH